MNADSQLQFLLQFLERCEGRSRRFTRLQTARYVGKMSLKPLRL
jgi:hypothetical protein